MVKRWMGGAFVLAAAFNGTLALIAEQDRRSLLDQALHTARSQSAALSDAVESQLDRADRTLSGIGEVLAANPALQQPQSEDAHRLLLRRHAISPFLRSLFLVGVDGRLRAASNDLHPYPLDLTDRAYYQALLTGDRSRLFVGAPIPSRLDGHWVIPVARGIEDQYGRLFLLVGAAIAATTIAELIAAQGFEGDTHVAILLPDGTPLACRALAGCDIAAGNLPPPFPMAAYPNGHGWSREAAYFGLGAVPGAYKRGEQYGLVVVVTGDPRTVLQPWYRILPTMIALAVSGTLAIFFATAVLMRQIERRAQALHALAQANASLEAKVAERTRDLRESEERLRGFIQAARDAVIIIDSQGRVEEYNPAAAQMFGYPREQVVGGSVGLLMPEDEAVVHDAHLARHRAFGAHFVGRSRELLGRRADGTLFPLEVTVGTHQVEGRLVHVGVLRDITERKANEDVLRTLANFDSLTGVFNRRHFMDEAHRLVALAQRSGRPAAVMMVDADHFKSINDQHGHDVGDVVLRALAATMAASLRATDVLGRLGGEEFAVALPDTDESGARELAARLLAAVRGKRIEADGKVLAFTVSIGLAVGSGETLETMLKRADDALYQAKRGGRDRVVVA